MLRQHCLLRVEKYRQERFNHFPINAVSLQQDLFFISISCLCFFAFIPAAQVVYLSLNLIIMDEQQNVNPNQLNIEITEEVAEGEYANLAIITHSHAEFVIDFVNVMPGTPKSKVKSRIIFTPQHAKRFMKALTENIQRFEQANGSIRDLEEMQIPLNFGGPTAQA